MKLNFSNLESNKPGFLAKDDLEVLVKQCEIIREEDTCLSDKIRLIKYEGEFFIQEKTPKDETIIRRFKNFKEADSFFYNRLQLYEKMWNGCGCKINYYE